MAACRVPTAHGELQVNQSLEAEGEVEAVIVIGAGHGVAGGVGGDGLSHGCENGGGKIGVAEKQYALVREGDAAIV